MEAITKAGHAKVSLSAKLKNRSLTSTTAGLSRRLRLCPCRRECTDEAARLGCRFCMLVLVQIPQLGSRGDSRAVCSRETFRSEAVSAGEVQPKTQWLTFDATAAD